VNMCYLGPIGVAAAAAISSTSKKRRRLHSFETNPSIRKRQQTRLQRCNFFHVYEFAHVFISKERCNVLGYSLFVL